jgi:hypothetical protein
MVAWKNIALPKSIRVWGLKNPFLFSKALVAKKIWRLIQGTIFVGSGSKR